MCKMTEYRRQLANNHATNSIHSERLSLCYISTHLFSLENPTANLKLLHKLLKRVFFSYDLDLDPMTLVYELDLYIVNIPACQKLTFRSRL